MNWSFIEAKRPKFDEDIKYNQDKRVRPLSAVKAVNEPMVNPCEEPIPIKKVAKVTGVVQPMRSLKVIDQWSWQQADKPMSDERNEANYAHYTDQH